MPATPWSHPLITCPAPSWNVNGSPRSHEASNCDRVDQPCPTYCMVHCLPATASGPSPTVRSSTCSEVGGSPCGISTTGLSGNGLSNLESDDLHRGDELVDAVVDGSEGVFAQH